MSELMKPKRKVWYQEKIERLEAENSRLNAMCKADKNPVTHEFSFRKAYAEGFYDAMSKYGILSKLQRKRLRENIEKSGKAATTKILRRSMAVLS